jgi:molecular chaperone DnaJ
VGDLLVTVDVQVPKNVDGEAREALETFRKITAGQDPRDELLRQAKAG